MGGGGGLEGTDGNCCGRRAGHRVPAGAPCADSAAGTVPPPLGVVALQVTLGRRGNTERSALSSTWISGSSWMKSRKCRHGLAAAAAAAAAADSPSLLLLLLRAIVIIVCCLLVLRIFSRDSVVLHSSLPVASSVANNSV